MLLRSFKLLDAIMPRGRNQCRWDQVREEIKTSASLSSLWDNGDERCEESGMRRPFSANHGDNVIGSWEKVEFGQFWNRKRTSKPHHICIYNREKKKMTYTCQVTLNTIHNFNIITNNTSYMFWQWLLFFGINETSYPVRDKNEGDEESDS